MLTALAGIWLNGNRLSGTLPTTLSEPQPSKCTLASTSGASNSFTCPLPSGLSPACAEDLACSRSTEQVLAIVLPMLAGFLLLGFLVRRLVRGWQRRARETSSRKATEETANISIQFT